jgi:hypothetical protein
MSTGRAIHHDEGLGGSLGGRIEIPSEVSRAAEERGGREPAHDLPSDLPEVGSEAFQTLNRRRVELIEKDIAGQLTRVEHDELERLETICGAVVERAFPLLPVDLDALIGHPDSLRAGEEGRGA